MADLAALPHAAIVVEDRYAAIFKQNRVRPATVADTPVVAGTAVIALAD